MVIRQLFILGSLSVVFAACGDTPPLQPGSTGEPAIGTAAGALAAPRHPTLLVVTSQALASAIQPFVDHKNATGVTTEVTTVQSIVATFAGKDDPEKIKRKIVDSYLKKGTRYVLLAGDPTQVPVRFRYVRSPDTSANGLSYNSADLYYANLFRNHDSQGNSAKAFDDWDLDGNGKFNEETWLDGQTAARNPDKVDGYPDVALGRVPAATATDLSHWVSKLIANDGLPRKSGPSVAFVADENYPGSTGLANSVEVSLRHLPAKDDHIVINHGGGTLTPPWFAGGLADVVSATSAYPWMLYIGHGFAGGWSSLGLDPTTLTNTNNLPVVMAASCDTGRFAPNELVLQSSAGMLQAHGQRYPGVIQQTYSLAKTQRLSSACASSATGLCALTSQMMTSSLTGDKATTTGDVDGDGLTDLISWFGGAALVELQSRDPGQPAPVFTGAYPAANNFFGDVANVVGDVDGNGTTDLIAWGKTGVRVKALTGDPMVDPFTSPQSWSTRALAAGEKATLAADVDGDTYADLVQWNANSVWVQFSKGSAAAGGFAAPVQVSSGAFYGDYANLTADLNSDKRADLVAWSQGFIWVKLSTGKGGYGPPLAFSNGNFAGTGSRAIFDVNGDHRDDLVAINENGVTVALTTGPLTAPVSATPASYSSSAVYPPPDPYLSDWRGTADWPGQSFATPWLFAQNVGAVAYAGETVTAPDGPGTDFLRQVAKGASSSTLFLGDVWRNAQVQYWRTEGKTDVLGAPRIFLGNMPLFGDPTFRLQYSIGPVAGDVDGDGFGDVVLTGGSGWGTVPVAFSSGGRAGAFRAVTNASVPTFPGLASQAGVTPVTTDLDGDGRMDLVLAGGGLTNVPVAISDGRGGFTVPAFPDLGLFPTFASQNGAKPVAGDFDGDGVGDVALTGGVGWGSIPVAYGVELSPARVTNSGVTGFPGLAAQSGAKPLAGDFDGDGFTDIALTGGSGWNSVPVAFSNGDGTFRAINGPLNAGSFGAMATVSGALAVAGDFDGDGRTDIALTGGPWTTIPVAFSNGDGTFTPTFKTVTSFPAIAQQGPQVVATDVDGDGKCDLALTGVRGWNTVPIAYSQGDGNFIAVNPRVDRFPIFAAQVGAKALGSSQAR